MPSGIASRLQRLSMELKPRPNRCETEWEDSPPQGLAYSEITVGNGSANTNAVPSQNLLLEWTGLQSPP